MPDQKPQQSPPYQLKGNSINTTEVFREPRLIRYPLIVSDGSFKVIYSASGATGNGVGNFNFQFSDATWTSTDELYTINVSPPGVPNFLYASKETDRVEITFDRNMADPTGKHLEFSVQDNGVDVTFNLLHAETR